MNLDDLLEEFKDERSQSPMKNKSDWGSVQSLSENPNYPASNLKTNFALQNTKPTTYVNPQPKTQTSVVKDSWD